MYVCEHDSADEDIDSTFATNVVVSSNGNCLWVPPGLFLSTCKIDITWFPFDDQQCKMKFGSWTYDSSGIDLQLMAESGDLSSFIPNGEWELIGETDYMYMYLGIMLSSVGLLCGSLLWVVSMGPLLRSKFLCLIQN